MNSGNRELVVSAPGRVGIIGNPTDMYGGAVLSCSVGLRARVTVTPADGLILETGGRESRIYDPADIRSRHDLFTLPHAVLDYLGPPPLACRVRYETDIPVRSGLAGSSALIVALLQAFLAWQGVPVHPYGLAERARFVELNFLKVVCGYQDAYMCTFGGLNYMDFRGKQYYRGAESNPFATVEPLAAFAPGLPFVVGFTGVQHASGAVHKPLRERWLEGDRTVRRGYRRITRLAQMGKKALLTADWAFLGSLMNENHAIQRDLGGSGEANERLIQAALDAGAPGAKLAGAGHGGTVIALWPWPDTSGLEEALLAAGASATYRPLVAPGVMIEHHEAGDETA